MFSPQSSSSSSSSPSSLPSSLFSNPTIKVLIKRISDLSIFHCHQCHQALYKFNYPAQDMEPGREGGTWLAVNPANGKIGILLNVLTIEKDLNPNAMGRGKIVNGLLDCDNTREYLAKLVTDRYKYNGFTFVALDMKPVPSASYVNTTVEPYVCNLGPGIYVFGNAKDPTKPFNKVNYGKDKFRDIVTDIVSSDRKEELIERLFLMVSDERRLSYDDKIHDQAYDMPDDHLCRLNSLFVKIPNRKYGSRTWSIILIDGQGNGDFIEKTRTLPITFTENDIKSDWKETRLTFKLND